MVQFVPFFFLFEPAEKVKGSFAAAGDLSQKIIRGRFSAFAGQRTDARNTADLILFSFFVVRVPS
jgi:hypothetical protein